MTVEEFLQKYQAFSAPDGIFQTTYKAQQEYKVLLTELGTTDVNSAEFPDKLLAVNEARDRGNGLVDQFKQDLTQLSKDYESLGFLDKRIDLVRTAVALLNTSKEVIIANTKEINAIQPDRPTIEANYKAAQAAGTTAAQNPEGQNTPAKKDASGQTPATNENLANDDGGTPTGEPDPEQVKKINQRVDDLNAPGRRLENPLSRYASYTYNISLYMITPTAYETFVALGRKNISQLAGGVYLVAQSGGIDETVDTTQTGTKIQRAPGFEFDYYIDNLRLKTTTGGRSTQTDSNTTDITFDIIEPNGFSFINKLSQAGRQVRNTFPSSYTNKQKETINAARQFFVLCVRFTGYDADGNIVREDETIERYYEIYIVSLKFKLNGKSTTYNIKAASLQPSIGNGNMHGRINETASFTGYTVGSILQGDDETSNSLVSKLNADQQKLAAAGYLPMEYDIVFEGPDSHYIKDAKLQLPNDIDKLSWPSSVPGLVERTSKAMQQYNQIKPADYNMRTVTLTKGISILQAISSIISRSTYLTDALKTVYDSNSLNQSTVTENTQNPYGEDISDKSSTRPLRWFNLGTRLSNIRWDPKRHDWVYKITYVIRPYETPNVVSSFAGMTTQYYGPHKRYQYWFTGENSEIISYEQQINSAYYLTDYRPNGDVTSGGSPYDVSNVPNQLQNQDRTAKLGLGMEAQNSYLNNLYSPSDVVTARIRILGDPDFLMQDSPGSPNEVYSKFYGSDGFTVNGNGGQVFIEINFNEAVDYDYEDNDGLMAINDTILFWAYPPEVRQRIKGNSYQVLSVESEFSRGAFFQTVNSVINPLLNLIKELQNKNANQTAAETQRLLRSGTPRTEENQSLAETRRLAATASQSQAQAPNPPPQAVTPSNPDSPDAYYEARPQTILSEGRE